MGLLATVAMLVALALATAAAYRRQRAADLRAPVHTRLPRRTPAELAGLTELPPVVAVRGRTMPGPNGLLRAPLSNLDCVWFRTEARPGRGVVPLGGGGAIAVDGIGVAATLAARPLAAAAPALTQTVLDERRPHLVAAHRSGGRAPAPVWVREQLVPAGLDVLVVGRPRWGRDGLVLEPAGQGTGTSPLTDRELSEHAYQLAAREGRSVRPLLLAAAVLFLLGLVAAAAA